MDTDSVKSFSTIVSSCCLPSIKATTMPATRRPAAQFEEEKKAPLLGLSQQAAPANEEALKSHKRLMAEYERQKKAKTIAIPTNDVEVRIALRQLKQPVCLFGEDAIARRERLKEIAQKAYIEEGRIPMLGKAKEKKEEAPENKELFYTHGSDELKAARSEITLFSIPRATLRYAYSISFSFFIE